MSTEKVAPGPCDSHFSHCVFMGGGAQEPLKGKMCPENKIRSNTLTPTLLRQLQSQAGILRALPQI